MTNSLFIIPKYTYFMVYYVNMYILKDNILSQSYPLCPNIQSGDSLYQISPRLSLQVYSGN